MEGDSASDQHHHLMHRPGALSSIGNRLLDSDFIAVEVFNRVTGKRGLWTLEKFEEKLQRMRAEANPNTQEVSWVFGRSVGRMIMGVAMSAIRTRALPRHFHRVFAYITAGCAATQARIALRA